MLPKKLIKEDRFEREIEYKLSEKEICKAFLKEYNKKNNHKCKDKKDYLIVANQMFCDSLNERINNKNEKNIIILVNYF